MSYAAPFRSIQPEPSSSSVTLGDLEPLGLLSLVRMVRAAINLQLLEHLPAEFILRQHSPHRFLDHRLRLFGPNETRFALLQAEKPEAMIEEAVWGMLPK